MENVFFAWSKFLHLIWKHSSQISLQPHGLKNPQNLQQYNRLTQNCKEQSQMLLIAAAFSRYNSMHKLIFAANYPIKKVYSSVLPSVSFVSEKKKSFAIYRSTVFYADSYHLWAYNIHIFVLQSILVMQYSLAYFRRTNPCLKVYRFCTVGVKNLSKIIVLIDTHI